MKRTNITLTEGLQNQLRGLSKETGLTISDLIRRAIELLVEKYKKEKNNEKKI